MITQLYTAINAALAAVNNTKYYTVVPDGAVYPHIFVFVVDQTFTQHKTTASIANDTIQTINVQIESRAKSVLDADTIRTQIMEAMYTAFHCRISTSQGVIYDSEEAVYRGMIEVEIMY